MSNYKATSKDDFGIKIYRNYTDMMGTLCALNTVCSPLLSSLTSSENHKTQTFVGAVSQRKHLQETFH